MQSEEQPAHAAGIGGGRYDTECQFSMVMTQAKAVCLIVLGGDHGSGFSVSTTVPNIAAQLPALLRDIAAQIEAAMEQTKGN